MRKLPLALTIVLATVIAPPAWALRASLLDRLPDNHSRWFGWRGPVVAALKNGGFVAAWDSGRSDGYFDSTARLYAADGSVVSDDLSCGNLPGSVTDYRSRVIPAGDGFVLACESVFQNGSQALAVQAHRYTALGQPDGEPAVFDEDIFTQMVDLYEGIDGSYVITVEQLGTEPFFTAFRRVEADDRIGPRLPLDYLFNAELLPIAGGRHLAVGFRQPFSRRHALLLAKRVTEDGTPVDRRVRLDRLGSGLNLVRTARGPGGRIAVGWRTLLAGVDEKPTLQVRLFDGRGVDAGETVSIAIPGPGTVLNAFALPLEKGFVLLWTTRENLWTEEAPLTVPWRIRTRAQLYTAKAEPVGDALEIGSSLLDIPSVAYSDAGGAWIVGAVQNDMGGEQPEHMEIWRLGSEPRCGDVNGDETANLSDVQMIARAAAGHGACIPCTCDLDGSGTIDGTDIVTALTVAIGGAPPPTTCPVCPALP